MNDPEIDKHGLLINYVNSSIYNYIEQTNNYGQAITLLERAYIKARNKIMAWHLLSTQTQLPGKSINKFFDNLRRLAKDSNFEAVDAQTHQQNMIRDAFIKWLESAGICQRLLAQDDITVVSVGYLNGLNLT